MHSDTAALTFNHSCRKIACLAAYCVGAHPLRVGTHSSPGSGHSITLRNHRLRWWCSIPLRGARKPYLLAVALLSEAVKALHVRDILSAPAISSASSPEQAV